MTREEILPFEEASVLCYLLAVFYGHSQRQINCRKYLDPTETSSRNTHAILYLLKEGGLPLDDYSFRLEPESYSPRSEEIEEMINFFMGLTDKGKAKTSWRAQELILVETVLFNIRRLSLILSKKNSGLWWFCLIALLHKKAKEALEARPELNANDEKEEEELFRFVRDDLYQRIERGVYREAQEDVISDYPRAWERVRVLLGRKSFL